MPAVEQIQYGLPTTTLSASTTAPTTGSTFALPANRTNRLSYITATAVTVSLNLVHEVSNDNGTWKVIATDSGTTGTLGSIELAFAFYRNRIVAGTGAGTTTVTITLGAY